MRIIARYSWTRALAWIAAVLASIGVLIYCALGIVSQADNVSVVFGIGLILSTLILIAKVLALSRQVFFRDRAAIWLDGETLRFLGDDLYPGNASLAIDQVARFEIGKTRMRQYKGIVAIMNNGKARYIVTALLSEGRDTVRRRLSDALPGRSGGLLKTHRKT